jgi:tetratricopeptide (TPR) repeat protein/CHAT domain-containing protein
VIPAAALLFFVLQLAPAADAIDPALSAAVARFFELQEQEDVAGYLALWSPSATAPRADQLKFVFETGDDKYSGLVISRVVLSGSRARVRVEIRRERTLAGRRPDGTQVVAAYPMSLALAFEKVGGEWKLLSEGPAADDLAASLLEAKDDAEREALLAAEPALAGRSVASSLGRLAGAAAVRQDYTEARRIYEQVVFAARRAGLAKEEGEALQNIANAFYFQRRFPEALAAYEQRLALERERHDDAGTAAALAGVATIRYSYAEYGEALKGYEEALLLHQKTDDVEGIAFVSLSIGNIGYLQGDFPAAIAAYQRSLDLNRTMFNVDGESRALEGLGRVFMAQGDYAGALAAFDAVRTDPRMASLHERLAPIAQSIGDVHFRLGNLDAARASYDESRSHFEAVKDMPNVGRALQGTAVTELAAGRFDRAEDLYKRSGGICTSAGDGECVARAIAGLAFAQSAQDKFWDAAASYRKAIAAFAARGLREEAARSEIGLSQALAGAGDFAGGVEAAARARRQANELESDDVLWRALTAEARAVRKLGDAERALGTAREAMTVLERLEDAARDKPAASLPADATGAVATLAVLLAERGDARAAFEASERMRAIDLRASLAVNERDIARGMSAGEREDERRLATTVATYLARIAREKGLPKPDVARIAALRQSLDEATRQRRSWMAQLYERLPDLASWRGVARAAGADLKPLLPHHDSLLLSLVLDEEALLILAVRPAPAAGETGPALADPIYEAYVVPVKRRQVAAMAAAISQAAVSDEAAWRKAVDPLTALLPPPVTGLLSAASEVAIVPHDVLWRIPFDALPSGEGYLGGHAHVVLGGSVAMLARAMRSAASPSSEVTVIGAPLLSAARIDRVRRIAPAWSLRTEDDAAGELRTASGDATHGAVALTGAGATEQSLREAIARGGVLHVAAPFRINSASPLFSAVLLTSPEAPPAAPATPSSAPGDTPAAVPAPVVIDPANDGALELREVMNVSAAARLALLTDGAATAMRDSPAAADVVQWGWLAAGVPTVVIARWGAPPDSRDRLLGEFHKRLRAGETVSDAWAAAQELIRSTPATAAPVHWAGWMLLGAAR